jgi:transcriptional regulator with XRE-family HTH domain
MSGSLAKLCAISKQRIARLGSQTSAMPRKTLNQVLGEVLSRLMQERGLSAAQLGKAAGVAPNTIGNYMRGGQAEMVTTGDKGKERSAELVKLEKIAKALDVSPLYLLTDPEEAQARAKELADVLVKGSGLVVAGGDVAEAHGDRQRALKTRATVSATSPAERHAKQSSRKPAQTR